MTKEREALKLALEALDIVKIHFTQNRHVNDAITAIKEALAQPERTWVGLTEQEHTDIAIQCGCMSADWVFYGATVERILKGKNS